MGSFSMSRTACMAVAAAAGAVIALFVRTPNWAGALFANSTAAGWAQAVGSLLGLAIAIWVPHNLARRADHVRQDDARRRAMSAALAMRLELKRIKWPLTRIINQWPDGGDAPLLVDLGEGGRQEIFEYFEFPKALPTFYGQMHELGAAADDVLRATFLADEVQILLNTLDADLSHTGGDNQKDIEHRLRIKIVDCLEHTGRAISLIDAMFQAVVPHHLSPLAG